MSGFPFLFGIYIVGFCLIGLVTVNNPLFGFSPLPDDQKPIYILFYLVSILLVFLFNIFLWR